MKRSWGRRLSRWKKITKLQIYVLIILKSTNKCTLSMPSKLLSWSFSYSGQAISLVSSGISCVSCTTVTISSSSQKVYHSSFRTSISPTMTQVLNYLEILLSMAHWSDAQTSHIEWSINLKPIPQWYSSMKQTWFWQSKELPAPTIT